MPKIAIIICDRYSSCGGGKCFRALRERVGGFSRYAAEEAVEVVGYATCRGCPGANVEYLPEAFKKDGADVVHLATGLVVGYPPCPYITHFRQYIETRFSLPVVVGTHPIPKKYLDTHRGLPFWAESGMSALAAGLMAEPPEIMEHYN